jgi:hypothetical protein
MQSVDDFPLRSRAQQRLKVAIMEAIHLALPVLPLQAMIIQYALFFGMFVPFAQVPPTGPEFLTHLSCSFS